jgi:hypothetical protein
MSKRQPMSNQNRKWKLDLSEVAFISDSVGVCKIIFLSAIDNRFCCQKDEI